MPKAIITPTDYNKLEAENRELRRTIQALVAQTDRQAASLRASFAVIGSQSLLLSNVPIGVPDAQTVELVQNIGAKVVQQFINTLIHQQHQRAQADNNATCQ